MRAAPAVSVDAGPTRALRAAQALLAAVAAAALAAWLAQHLGLRGIAGWAGAAAALAGAAAGWRWPTSTPARLAWTGAEWTVRWRHAADGEPVTPELAIDLGPWMLLRLRRVGARAAWVEVTEGHCGSSWAAWRTAVYSSCPSTSRRSPAEQQPP